MTPMRAARTLFLARLVLLLSAFVLSGVWAWRHEGLFRLFTEALDFLTPADREWVLGKTIATALRWPEA